MIDIPSNTGTFDLDAATPEQRAVYLLVEAEKAGRAGAYRAPVIYKAQEARDEAVAAGASHTGIHRQADEGFIQYIRNCWNPGYEPRIDYDGTGRGVTAREEAEQEQAAKGAA